MEIRAVVSGSLSAAPPPIKPSYQHARQSSTATTAYHTSCTGPTPAPRAMDPHQTSSSHRAGAAVQSVWWRPCHWTPLVARWTKRGWMLRSNDEAVTEENRADRRRRGRHPRLGGAARANCLPKSRLPGAVRLSTRSCGPRSCWLPPGRWRWALAVPLMIDVVVDCVCVTACALLVLCLCHCLSSALLVLPPVCAAYMSSPKFLLRALVKGWARRVEKGSPYERVVS